MAVERVRPSGAAGRFCRNVDAPSAQARQTAWARSLRLARRIDGAISGGGRVNDPAKPDAMLDPDAIATTYLSVLRQPRSAWTWEIELRPWVERF